MAVEQISAGTWGPGEDRGDHQDQHPRVSLVKAPRETGGTGPEDHLKAVEEDIAPGVIEYRPARPPVLYRTGSAAMVVAAATGRVAGLSARHAWTGGRWFGHGVRHSAILGWRYVRAHDHQEVIGGMSSDADWNKIERTKRRRWWFLAKVAAGTIVADLGAWWALVAAGHMAASDAWAVAPGAEAVAAATALTLYGRYRLDANLAPGQIVDPDDIDDTTDGGGNGNDPFPLAWCTTGDQVEECLSRALAAEGISTRGIRLLASKDWGYELDVTLRGSTPGKVQAAADQIEAHLALPDGGFMPEPDTKDKAHVVVRLVQSNPFTGMPSPQVHAPRSLSVHDTIVMGRAMDGSPFEMTLDGLCSLIIGAMGAGKTLGALRTLAEALTACVDAVCYDLDPIKGGLSEFGDLMAKRARTPEECEQVLEEVLAYITARSVLMPKLGMGDRWHASEEHPNLYVFIDEYIQLTPRGKELAIKILRTGRQYGIYLEMAGQEATADALGDAIALIIAYRILMACRFEDVRIAFGPGAGALGWRPDRMKPAVGPVANDAGQAMIMGGLFNRAIRYQFNKYTREQIVRAVPARVAAGVNRMDADTLLEAGQSLASADQRVSLADRLDVLAEQGGIEDARLVAVLLREFELSGEAFLPTSEVLLPALANAGFEDVDGGRLGRILKAHAPDAASVRQEWDGRPQVRGWQRATIERAAAGLIDPAKARQQAA